MFHVQGSFEQSLRCGDEVSPNGNKTLAALAKIHKHCIGKAHANGCVDHKHNPLAKSDSNTSLQSKKSFRGDCIIEIKEADRNQQDLSKPNDGGFTKSFSNSTSSYEGHSDTDSENFKSKVDPNKAMDPCERLFAQNTKASLMKTARMRYADDPVVQDEVDGDKTKQTFVRTPSRSSYRERKSGVVTIEQVKSDCANHDEELGNSMLFDDKKKTPTQNKSMLQRKGSTGSSASNGKANGVKPPWKGASKNGIPPESFIRTPSLRGSIRKKTTKNDGVPWRKLYELSLWRRCGVSFATVGADTERALLRPWSELSSQHHPPPVLEVSSTSIKSSPRATIAL